MNRARRFEQTLPQLVLFATFTSLLVLAERAPARFERAMQEDGWAEWATFSSFLLAAVLALRTWSTSRRSERGQGRTLPWLTQLAYLGLAVFCLFVAGEEISWGQRLLGFRPPALFLANNYQQESNLHNLLKGILDTRWMVFMVAVAYGMVAPYLAHVTRFPRVLAAPLALLPWFAVVAWLELAYPYELVGELAEMMLGFLFLADVLERRHSQTSERADTTGEIARSWWREPGLMSAGYLTGALLLAVVCLPLNDVSLRANTNELVAHTESDLRTLAERMQKGDTLNSALFRKREIHKRLYTAVKAGYVDLEREEFYLDAWNSPYWISFERGKDSTGRVVLYSFGPNRRRDLDVKQQAGSVGDDVRIAVEVAQPARAER